MVSYGGAVRFDMHTRTLWRPRGNGEHYWSRPLVFYLLVVIIFANLIRLYSLLDVH